MSDVGVWRLGAAIRLGIIVQEDYKPPAGSGNFGPRTPITRREATVQIERALGHSYLADSTGDHQVPFWDMQGAWFRGYVYQAMQDGIITGYPDGSFRDANPVTRAEAIVIVRHARDYQNSLGIQETGYNFVIGDHKAPVVQYNGILYIPADILSYLPNNVYVYAWSPPEQQYAILTYIGGINGHDYAFYEANVSGGSLKPGDTFMWNDPSVAGLYRELHSKGYVNGYGAFHFKDSAIYYHGHVYIPSEKVQDEKSLWNGKWVILGNLLVFNDKDRTVTVQIDGYDGTFFGVRHS